MGKEWLHLPLTPVSHAKMAAGERLKPPLPCIGPGTLGNIISMTACLYMKRIMLGWVIVAHVTSHLALNACIILSE